MKRHDVNPIDVVEAAYDLDATDSAWLDRIARTLRPFLDDGHGMFAYTFDATTTPNDWYKTALFYDFDRRHLPRFVAAQIAYPDLLQAAHFNFEGLLGLREVGERAGLGDIAQRPKIADAFARVGIEDMVALQTVEPGGKGVTFAAGLGAHRRWDRRTKRLWARVNVHIAAGRRLRAAIATTSGGTQEAILDARGKVHHAEGECTTKSARDVLRESVVRIEKSRGKQRRSDPEGAIDGWTALVSGRWSLVDRFERGGRRYIVARRNEHSLPDPRALTVRERAIAHLAALGKPNKLIGYELGLAESTIGSHLSTIMRKLGVTRRVDLIQLLAQLGGPPSR